MIVPRRIFSNIPVFLKSVLKRIYFRFLTGMNCALFIQSGRSVAIGYRFRFTRTPPYGAVIGDRTAIDDFTVWSAKMGDIIVGRNCWFGLHNVIMGPVEIGDGFSSGPFVSIVGPHNAVTGFENKKTDKTIIGKNVWASTGSIIQFGVRIGDNAIIAPGAVINRDVPPNAVMAGNPARNISSVFSPNVSKAGGEQQEH